MKTVNVKFEERELEILKQRANEEGIGYNELIKKCALEKYNDPIMTKLQELDAEMSAIIDVGLRIQRSEYVTEQQSRTFHHYMEIYCDPQDYGHQANFLNRLHYQRTKIHEFMNLLSEMKGNREEAQYMMEQSEMDMEEVPMDVVTQVLTSQRKTEASILDDAPEFGIEDMVGNFGN